MKSVAIIKRLRTRLYSQQCHKYLEKVPLECCQYKYLRMLIPSFWATMRPQTYKSIMKRKTLYFEYSSQFSFWCLKLAGGCGGLRYTLKNTLSKSFLDYQTRKCQLDRRSNMALPILLVSSIVPFERLIPFSCLSSPATLLYIPLKKSNNGWWIVNC